MEWNLTRPEEPSSASTDEMIEAQVKRNVMFANLEDLIAWAGHTLYGRLILAFPAVTWKWLLHSPRGTTLPVSAPKLSGPHHDKPT